MSIVVNKTRLPVTQWQTESGSVVSIADARKRYAKSLSVALEPIQDLHGYSNPWVGGAGKNKIKPCVRTTVQSDVTFEAKLDGSISISGTASGNAWVHNSISGPQDSFKIAAGDYFLSGNSVGNANKLNLYLVFREWGTTGGVVTTNYDQGSGRAVHFETDVEAYVQVYAASGFSGTYVIYPQLELGSTATAFEPYENLCPISGRSSVTAVRDGKNLTPYADKGHSTRIWGSTWPNQLALIKTLKPSQYTISAKYKILTNPNNEATVDMGMLLRWRDSGGTWHQIIRYQLTTVSAEVGAIHNYSKTFTLSEDDLSAPNLEFYLYCGTGTTAVTANCYDFQIELCSTATAYEPYQGISVTLSLGQTVYGGTVDVVSGVMTVTSGIVDMSVVNWTRDTSRAGVFYGGITGRLNGSNVLACSCYKVDNIYVSTSEDAYISGAVSYGGNVVFFRDTTLAGKTRQEVQTARNGETIVYELATPLTIQLSQNQIEMLMRNNTVWSDAGVVTLNYARIRT